MRAGRRLLLVALVACGPRGPAPVLPISAAGDHRDDASGLLAHASATLVTGPADDEEPADPPQDDDPPPAERRRLRAGSYGVYGGLGYGGLGYGGLAYGGLAYAGAAAGSSWAGVAAAEPASYDTEEGLTGAIEGVVTWQGALPPRLAGACAATLHVARDHGVGGALVFIEKIDVGRAVVQYAHAVTVGGVIVKHGCALLPAAQIVAPLPGILTIYGDATPAKLRATAPTGATRALALEEGGQAHLDALAGVVRVDGEDGKLAPAWVIGLDSPYYAITDDAGRFRIDELAAGTYDVAIWQAPVGTAAPGGAIAYGAPIVVHRKVTVATDRASRLDVALK